MSRPTPYTFAIQVQAADGWRNITTYTYDTRKEGRADGRSDAFRRARLGLHAWRRYHKFEDQPMRIAECVLPAFGIAKWEEAQP